MVGHVSMADPFDGPLSKAIHTAISQPGVLEGDDVKAHIAGTVICIGMIYRYLAARSILRVQATSAKNIRVGQKDLSSPPAPNPSSTAPSPRNLQSPWSTCPPCPNANSFAKPKSHTPSSA